MAKTCWIERQKRKTATVAKYAALRAQLKKEKLALRRTELDGQIAALHQECENVNGEIAKANELIACIKEERAAVAVVAADSDTRPP